MSYTLGTTTLPRPRPGKFKTKSIETSGSVTALNGTLKKDIVNRKFQYVFEYEGLTIAEVASILTEHDLQAVRNFVVDETNLTIASTSVHIEVTDREAHAGGLEYLEDLVLTLTEVS